MYPNVAGTMMATVARNPRDTALRNESKSLPCHAEDIAGSSAVNAETAKMACGSWKKMYA